MTPTPNTPTGRLSAEEWDKLGRMVDSLDNAVAANRLPMPDRLKIDGMTGIVETVRDSLMAFVIEHSGNNPWGDWGEDPS